MAQYADRVHAQADEVDRLAALCARLDDTVRFVFDLIDGTRFSGVVVTRPVLQTFIDHDGNEGINAVLRLDGIDGDADRTRFLWLDEVLEVSRQMEMETGADDGQT